MMAKLQRKLDDWLLTLDLRALYAWALRILIIGVASGMLGILIANRL